MSWHLEIKHESRYTYGSTVSSSYNEARLTPRSSGGQRVLHSRVESQPASQPLRYVDYWGTIVHAFDLQTPHSELVVISNAVVQTGHRDREMLNLTWDEIETANKRLYEFTTLSGYCPTDDAMQEVSSGIRSAAKTPADAFEAIRIWAMEEMHYSPGSTHVSTTATEAFHKRSGVCQDYAHVTIALLRSLGIPSRYISGYLHPDPEADPGISYTGQSHAWIQAWLGNWISLDPTIGETPGDRHVFVASGRDYGDVPPIKGIVDSARGQHLTVSVEMTLRS